MLEGTDTFITVLLIVGVYTCVLCILDLLESMGGDDDLDDY